MKTKHLLVITFIFISIILFFAITGTPTSGYHFTDDHEIIKMTDGLSQKSVFTVTAEWIKSDLSIRYRPVFYFHRVLEAKIFGNNFTLWSLYNILLFFVSIICFYCGMIKLKFSVLETLCFLTLVFLGTQTAIWWRLGPNETIGMFFLGIAFYFMLHCEKKYTLNTALFCFFLICASLSKESFTIIIPAFLVFKIWYEKELFQLSLKEAVLKNKLLLMPFIVMIFNLFVIVFVVGTNKIEYAGVSNDGVFVLLKQIISIIQKQLAGFIAISFLFLVVIYYELKDEKKFFTFFKALIFPLLFCSLIAGPNIFLYAKSGMEERYLLPCLVGVAFFVVSIIKETRLAFRWLSYLFIAAFLVFSIKPTYLACQNARAFYTEGRKNKDFLAAALSNNKNTSNMLFVGDPGKFNEPTWALKEYLLKTKNIKLFAYAIEAPYRGNNTTLEHLRQETKKSWYSWFDGRMLDNMTESPAVILFIDKSLADRFFNESGIPKEKYTNVLTGITDFAVYVEKK